MGVTNKNVCVYWCCGYHDCVCVQVNDPPVQRALNIDFAAVHTDVVAQTVVAPQLTPEEAAKQYYQRMLQQHGPEAMIMLQEAARYIIGISR